MRKRLSLVLSTISIVFILSLTLALISTPLFFSSGCGSDSAATSDDDDDNDSEEGASGETDTFDTDTLSSGDWTLRSTIDGVPALTDPDTWLTISDGVLSFTAPDNYILARSEDGGDGSYGIYKTFSQTNLQVTAHYVSANNLEYYGPPGLIVDGVYLEIVSSTLGGGSGQIQLHWHMGELGMSCANDSDDGTGNETTRVSENDDDNCPGDPGPAWLRIVKEGNTLTGYYSADGSTFTQVGDSISVDLGDSYDVELMFANGEDSNFTISADSVTFE